MTSINNRIRAGASDARGKGIRLGLPNEHEDMGLLGEEGCLKRLSYLLLCTHASQERLSDGPIEI